VSCAKLRSSSFGRLACLFFLPIPGLCTQGVFCILCVCGLLGGEQGRGRSLEWRGILLALCFDLIVYVLFQLAKSSSSNCCCFMLIGITFTLKKLRCSKQAFLRSWIHSAWDETVFCLEKGTWRKQHPLFFLFCSFWKKNKKGGGRGCWYAVVRGEILGSSVDHLQQRHSPRTPPLIKSESQGIKDDQIPS